ncbi:putative DNA-binding WGR domain protein [Sphingomonas insulae]|uniref:WGR domain-containing protein n=1 Tax=Sphingomonas insulae TaxID=424800 RepID=A0ABP3SYD0_9SPHN|nr:WGR domain-containing protein [Sphingomonas insulae]NIJ31520.1 putative DNA-binding WGR domain protein [Sphingomonas insulae]
MDTLPFTPVDLIAIDAARNIRRRWHIAAYRDLFGRVMIETGWGRIGWQGHTLVRSFVDEGGALRYVRVLLARRRRATRRIGTAYQPIVSTCRSVDTFTRRALSTPLPS